MQRISVTKCQGTGNDFVLFDARRHEAKPHSGLAKFLCDRHIGVGADGLLVVRAAADSAADLQMQIFNPDGSEAEMCGNGICCLARYIHEREPGRERLRIATLAGVVETTVVAQAAGSVVRVTTLAPEFTPFPDGQLARRFDAAGERVAAYIVSMGNPHVTVFIQSDPARVDLAALARHIESWHLYPSPPNVEVASLTSNAIVMRVYERGVGETFGCGTGACAVAVAAVAYLGARSPLQVTTQGGSVEIEWNGSGQPAVLIGGAQIVFDAEVVLPDALLKATAAV